MLAQFLAKRLHVHVNGARTAVEVPAPHALQQRLAGKDHAGLAHEVLEQVELAQGELKRLAGNSHLTIAGREHDVAHAEHIACLFDHAAATQQCAAAARKLHEREGFSQVIVGTAIERHHLVELGILGGKHHDGHRRRQAIGTQSTHNRQAIGIGQHDVEQDGIGYPSRHGSLKLTVARKAFGLNPLLAQRIDRQIPDVVIVLDVIDHVEPLCGRHDRILTLKVPLLDGISQNAPSNNPPCADRSDS